MIKYVTKASVMMLSIVSMHFAVAGGVEALSLEDEMKKNAWYVTGKAGVTGKPSISKNDIRASFKPGYDLSLAVGKEVRDNWRFDGEFGYTYNQVKRLTRNGNEISGSGQAASFYLLGNAYYDFHNKSQFIPYVGAGMGLAFGSNSRIYHWETTGVGFAYQASGGVRTQINDNIGVGLGARYLNWTADFNNKGVFSGMLTLNYRFA